MGKAEGWREKGKRKGKEERDYNSVNSIPHCIDKDTELRKLS
jgi:hypothetical protein